MLLQYIKDRDGIGMFNRIWNESTTSLRPCRISDSMAPQDHGYNKIRLIPDSDRAPIRLHLKGHAETGANGWTYGFVAVQYWHDDNGVIGQRPADARTGTWNARFGGANHNAVESLAYMVQMPFLCQLAVLTFWIRVDSQDSPDKPYDELELWVHGDQIAVPAREWSNQTVTNGYMKVAVNLLGFSGQLVQLQFRGLQNNGLRTIFSIDDMELYIH